MFILNGIFFRVKVPFTGGISVKLSTNVHHVKENCCKGFQGQKSEVKVTCVQMCECCNAEVYISAMWHWGSLVMIFI